MTTSEPVVGDDIVREDDVIVVVRRGRIIGVLSEAAQENVRTVRLTFTRTTPKDQFQPLQGVVVEMFPQNNDE